MTPTEGEGDILFLVRILLGVGITLSCLCSKLPNLSQKVLVCIISHELVGRFQKDLHGYNICDEELIRV